MDTKDRLSQQNVQVMIPPRRRFLALTDPLVHAAIAAGVVAPLASAGNLGPVGTAVATGTLVDLDHPLAARSLQLGAILTLDTRPRTHCLLSALAAGVVAWGPGGRLHAWAAFAGLAAHLLYDAGDDDAPTPLLWPLAPARQIGRARSAAGIGLLALGSALVARRNRHGPETTNASSST
jgi:LexA-binding, inner membrane-associated putative hydrolase